MSIYLKTSFAAIQSSSLTLSRLNGYRGSPHRMSAKEQAQWGELDHRTGFLALSAAASMWLRLHCSAWSCWFFPVFRVKVCVCGCMVCGYWLFFDMVCPEIILTFFPLHIGIFSLQILVYEFCCRIKRLPLLASTHFCNCQFVLWWKTLT